MTYTQITYNSSFFDDVMLTTKEAADYLNTPPSTLIYWRRVKHGPPIYRSDKGEYRYRRGDILQFIYWKGREGGLPRRGIGSRDRLASRLAARSTKRHR